MTKFIVLGWEEAKTPEHKRLFLHVLNYLEGGDDDVTIEITPPHYIDNPKSTDFQCYMTVKSLCQPEYLFGYWDSVMYGCENSEDSELMEVR